MRRRGCAALVIIALGFSAGYSQSTEFDLSAYQQFLSVNRTLTGSQLRARYDAGLFTASVSPASQPVAYLDSIVLKYSLTGFETEQIASHGFVVSSRLAKRTFMEAFGDIYNKDLPVFISSDAVLQAIHNSYDNILKDIEKAILSPALISALESMHSALAVLDQRYGSDARMTKALRDVDTYLAVPLSLLGKPVRPFFADNAWQVQSLLRDIENKQPKDIPLFAETSRTFDFSQFTVRGHYTKDSALARYFRAMIWLGRTEFYLTAPRGTTTSWPEADIQRQLIDAVLVAEAARDAGALPALRQIDTILRFLVGESDNVIVDSLLTLNTEAQLQSPTELLDTTRSRGYQRLLLQKRYSAQRIISQIFFTDPLSPDQVQPPSTFLLLGQRFVIDSYITGNVVYDRIVHEGTKIRRMLPSTLDVLFALGNNAAGRLLEGQLEAYHYAPNLSALRYLVDSYGEDFWQGSMFNAWLQMIRTLNPPSSRGNLPPFMQTAAWWQEKLNTQLGSWAQLRHDNLLYAKQSYTLGIVCSYPEGYVEPIPAFYDAVKTYAVIARSRLAPLGLKGIAEFFQRLAGAADTLGSIAHKELSALPLSADERRFLKSMLAVDGVCGAPYRGWYPDLYYGMQFVPHDSERKTDFVVVDLHTAPTDAVGFKVGWVLHAGTGPVDMSVVSARIPGGGPCAYVGPVMNYYEHLATNFKRLTDEEWATLYNVAPSLRPGFVNLYLADEKGGSRGPGPSLLTGPTDVYDQIGVLSPDLHQNYPNPFNSSTVISFTLPQQGAEQQVSLEVYDVQGRLIIRLVDEPLPGGNYSVCWRGTNGGGMPVASGIYFVRLKAGMHVMTKTLGLIR